MPIMNTHSIELNGVDGYVNFGNPAAVNDIGTGDFSIVARIKCRNTVVSSNNHQPILIKSTFATGDWGFMLNGYYDDHRLSFHYDGTTLMSSSEIIMNGSVWKYVIVTRSGATVKFLIGGVITDTFSASNFSLANAKDLIAGARIPFSGDRRVNGFLDEMSVWSKVISEAEAQDMENRSLSSTEIADPDLVAYWPFNNDALDYSQNDIHGTLIGGVTYSTDVPFSDPVIPDPEPEPDAWLGTNVFQLTDYYNVSDFNRENINAEYIRLKLIERGYVTNFTKPVRSLLMSDFPFVEYIDDLRTNINSLINIYTTKTAQPIIISGDQIQSFDYAKANELELPQQEIYELIDLMEQLYRYSGTFSAGQEVSL